MALFYLVRHAVTEGTGRILAGRMPGVHLSRQGIQQVDALSARLAEEPIRRVMTSPLERAHETAARLAKRLGLTLETSEQLLELDFGAWTGRTFEELERDPRWNAFNTFRSGTRIPEGETMLEAQMRIVSLMGQIQQQTPDTVCALVSHGDMIRGALLYWLGMPLDAVHRLEIAPASISAVRLDAWGAQVVLLNSDATSLWGGR